MPAGSGLQELAVAVAEAGVVAVVAVVATVARLRCLLALNVQLLRLKRFSPKVYLRQQDLRVLGKEGQVESPLKTRLGSPQLYRPPHPPQQRSLGLDCFLRLLGAVALLLLVPLLLLLLLLMVTLLLLPLPSPPPLLLLL
jgi:hypothetical protein